MGCGVSSSEASYSPHMFPLCVVVIGAWAQFQNFVLCDHLARPSTLPAPRRGVLSFASMTLVFCENCQVWRQVLVVRQWEPQP